MAGNMLEEGQVLVFNKEMRRDELTRVLNLITKRSSDILLTGGLVNHTYLLEPPLLLLSSWSLHIGFLSSFLLVRASHHPVRVSVIDRGQTQRC